jgi:hypothetical protein
MSWNAIVSSFHITTAADLLAAARMLRHQDVRATATWLPDDAQPLALLFLSHRWESPEHPDLSGRLMAGIHRFLEYLLVAVEATLVPRPQRIALVPSLTVEGMLQAEEIARRLLGFGPFSDDTASVAGSTARAQITERFRACGANRLAFRDWLARRIGVWLDYTCMPQRPLAPDDEVEVQHTLEMLDQLVGSSSLVALRSERDDYARRGWCLLEAFMGSARSFARGVVVDIDRLDQCKDVPIPAEPVPRVPDALAAEVMTEAYQQDLEAFRDACARWLQFDGPLVEIGPPDPWSAYRSLQGSAFPDAKSDPNPFRPALEVVRDLETALIDRWLMSPEAHVFDLGRAVRLLMERHRIRCLDAAQLTLGLTFACNGWVDAFRPLLRASLRLSTDVSRIPESADGAAAVLAVRLRPIDEKARDLFGRVQPANAGAWQSRLAQRAGGNEASVINELKEALLQQQSQFELLTVGDALRLAAPIEHLAV